MLALHLDYYLDSFISVLARASDEVDDIQIDIRKGFRDAFDADDGAVQWYPDNFGSGFSEKQESKCQNT